MKCIDKGLGIKRKNNILRVIYVLLSVMSAFMIIAPTNVFGLMLHGISGFCVTLLICLIVEKIEYKTYVHKELLGVDFIVALLLGYRFYEKWLPSSAIAVVARYLNLSVTLFLMIIALVLGCFSIGFIDWMAYQSVRKLRKYSMKFGDKYIKNSYIWIGCILFLQYLSIQYSALSSLELLFKQSWRSVLINILVVLAMNILLLIFIQKWNATLIITSLFICIWSIANYYVIMFHGSPLFISEMRNFTAAAAVVGSYNYKISVSVVLALVICVTEIKCILKKISLDTKNSLVKRSAIRVGVLVASVLAIGTTLKYNVLQKDGVAGWKNELPNKGFMVLAIEDMTSSVNPISKPEGYELSKVVEMPTIDDGFSESKKRYPDIVLILNESFYDLQYYASITTDENYLEKYYDISNAMYGYVITPNVGGGTNNSEYELLFSKSMYLLEGAAPFTYLDASLLERSSVKYLEEIGYVTTGMHCGGEQNYMRHIAYPKMGFDNIYLGPSAFSNISDNGNRLWLDMDNYNDLIGHYETIGDEPQFMYLLTFQNHGGYEQNEDYLDTVHVAEDLGDLTDDVNEYLTSIELSAKAFNELTKYYETVDRDVIVCMVGDHAPSFIEELPAKTHGLVKEQSINARTVPYVVWANYDISYPKQFEYVSMTDVLPMVFEMAEIPLSKYFETILKLQEQFPIRTSDGLGVNSNYEVFQYDVNDEEQSLWTDYLYMEYNSMQSKKDYREQLFLP